MGYVDFKKYPFLVDAQSMVRARYGGALSVTDVVTRSESVRLRAVERVRSAIDRGVVSDPPRHLTTEEEVLAYHLGVVLVSFVGDGWLTRRYADAESERAYRLLLAEDEETVTSVSRALGLDVEYHGTSGARIPYVDGRGNVLYHVYPFSIRLSQYLKLTRRLRGDPSWKLVNQMLRRGRVYLDKRRLARVVREAVYMKVAGSVVPLGEKPPGPIERLVQEVVEAVRKRRGREVRPSWERPEAGEAVETAPATPDDFPPCMKSLYEQAARGENLSHHARFALATFLLNVGMEVDEVLSVFRNMPDFNERVARYQVEHLAGLRGSRKRYLPYSCATMRSLGLCVGECGVRNPLSYYVSMRRRAEARERRAGG